ncbi:MAG: biotin/lipoyl-binding protein, partial [Gammaproteobacteria bacterium]
MSAAAPPTPAPAARRLEALEPTHLAAALAALERLRGDEEAWRRALLELLLQLTGGAAAAVVVANSEAAYAVGPSLVSPQAQAWLGAPEQAFAAAAAACRARAALAVLPASRCAQARVLAAPARAGGQSLALVTAEEPAPGVMIVLQLLAAQLDDGGSSGGNDRAGGAALARLASALRAADSATAALGCLAEAVAGMAPGATVMVLCHRHARGPGLLGGSGDAGALDSRGAVAREFLAAAETVRDTGVSSWPGAGGDDRLAALAAQLGATRLVLLAGTCDDAPGSRLVVAIASGAATSDAVVPADHTLAAFIADAAPLLALSLDGLPSAPARALRRLRGAHGRRRLAVAATVCAVAVLVGAWPVRDRVAAEVELQPELQRVLAAPFDAVLAETLVRAGDRVTAGQALVRLDGRELVIERAALSSELAQLDQRLASRRAAGATDDVMQLGLERHKVSLRLAHLEE